MRASELRTLVPGIFPGWPDVDVACIWLPQLPLRGEILRHPAWDGHPLVLGNAPGERKVVQLCSPEAEAAGIRPGLPIREVVPLCRQAIIVSPDPVRVATVLEEVLDALQRVSPLIEVAEDSFLFASLRGLKRLYEGDLALLERTLRQAVPPLLRPRIGFAHGKFAASIAARVAPPSGTRVVAAQRAAAFLAPLPTSFLPLEPGILQQMELLGLRTIGAFIQLPFGAVQAQFGLAGARAWRLGSGHDSEPIIPRRYLPAVQAALRFDDPLGSVEALMAAIDHLLAETFGQPVLYGLAVRQARLRALLSDGTSWERVYTFKEALASRGAVRLALKSKLELPNGFPPAPIEEMRLELLRTGGMAVKQPGLFVEHARQLSQIGEAARQLRARYGRVPLYHAVEVEPWSRIPERRWALMTCEL